MEKRYFILSFMVPDRRSGTIPIITDGTMPTRNSIMKWRQIPTNALSVMSLSEVKSIDDLRTFFENPTLLDEHTDFTKRDEY